MNNDDDIVIITDDEDVPTENESEILDIVVATHDYQYYRLVKEIGIIRPESKVAKEKSQPIQHTPEGAKAVVISYYAAIKNIKDVREKKSIWLKLEKESGGALSWYNKNVVSSKSTVPSAETTVEAREKFKPVSKRSSKGATSTALKKLGVSSSLDKLFLDGKVSNILYVRALVPSQDPDVINIRLTLESGIVPKRLQYPAMVSDYLSFSTRRVTQVNLDNPRSVTFHLSNSNAYADPVTVTGPSAALIYAAVNEPNSLPWET